MTIILIQLLSGVLTISAQSTKYDIDVRLDTVKNIIFVKTEIIVPSAISSKDDSLWFYLPANTYSNTNNTFTDELLKWGHSEFYFRKPIELSAISNFKISAGSEDIPYSFTDDQKTIAFVKMVKSNRYIISYTLRLPALIDGLGYDKGNIWLRNFYPQLIFFDGQTSTHDTHQFVQNAGVGSDYSLHITPVSGYQIISNGDISMRGDTVDIAAFSIKNLSIVLLKNYKYMQTGGFKSGNNIIPYSLVFFDNYKPKIWNDAQEIINKIISAMEKYFGSFPYKKLSLMMFKNCEKCFESSGFVLTKDINSKKISLENYLANQISSLYTKGLFDTKTKQNKWLITGLSAYYQQRFSEEFSYKNGNHRYEKYSKNYKNILQDFRKKRLLKPLYTPESELDENQIFTNRNYLALAFFQYLQTIVGKEVLDEVLRSFAGTNKSFTPNTLISHLEKRSGRPLKSFLELYINSEGYTDYAIENVVNTNDTVDVLISNKDSLRLPFILTVTSKSGNNTAYYVPGFTGSTVVKTDRLDMHDIESVSIDYTGVLPEINRVNNQYFPNQMIKKGAIKPVFLLKNNKNSEMHLYLAGYPLYNDNDGMMIGATITNGVYNDTKPFTFALSPFYSFSHKKLLGQTWVSYDQFFKDSGIQRIRYRAGIKSFDFNTNQTNNYSQRYIRLDPSIGVYFRHQPINGVESSLTLKAFFISEQYPSFENNGQYKGLDHTISHIYRLEYQFRKVSTLSTSMFHISAEQQSYQNQHYIKLTNIIEQRYMYASRKNLYIRLFGSAFIQNTRRESSSYQNLFTKGSIALIQQGYNDYTYDEYFFSRQNQSGFQNNQVSQVYGGGFKTPVGSAYSIGLSNNFAASVNFSADFPFIPHWIPLRLYFDIGTYSTFAKDKFVNNVMYNGGFSIHWRDAFALHLPLVFSKDLGNIYNEEHKTLLSCVSFSLNLHKAKIWY